MPAPVHKVRQRKILCRIAKPIQKRLLEAILAIHWQIYFSTLVAATPQASKRSLVNACLSLLLYVLRQELAWATTLPPSNLKGNFNQFLLQTRRRPCLSSLRLNCCAATHDSTNSPRYMRYTRTSDSPRFIQKHNCTPSFALCPDTRVCHVLFFTSKYPLKLHFQAVLMDKRMHLLE